MFGTPFQIKLKKKLTALSSRNLLTIGLTWSVNAIYVLFSVSRGMSILYCQYDLGSDPFLVGNGFHYFFYFCLILLSLFICELYIYIFLMILFIITNNYLYYIIILYYVIYILYYLYYIINNYLYSYL